MDLRAYYKKVREAEAALTGEHHVMVSLETAEGGKPGVRTETSRLVAAKLIAEGRAKPATAEEAQAFHAGNRDAKERQEQQEAAKRIQVMVIPSGDLKKSEPAKQPDRS